MIADFQTLTGGERGMRRRNRPRSASDCRQRRRLAIKEPALTQRPPVLHRPLLFLFRFSSLPSPGF